MSRISLLTSASSLFLALSMFSCSSVLTSIERDGSRWVAISQYYPKDNVIFDFEKGEVKNVEGELYKFKVRRNAFYWPTDSGVVKERFSSVKLTGDTLKVIGNDYFIKLLKYDRVVAPKTIVADSLVGPLFKVVSGYPFADSVTTYTEFVSTEKGVWHSVKNATGEVFSEPFSWTLEHIDGVFLMTSMSSMSPHFLIADYSNDTIKAVRPTIRWRKLTTNTLVGYGFDATALLLTEEKSIQPKVLMEDLIGDWEVTEFMSPYYQKIWSVRVTRDRLFLNEQGFGRKLNVPWYLDRFGNLIKANLKNVPDDDYSRWDVYKLDIFYNDGKLIVADGIESYTLQRKSYFYSCWE